ncbi:hypothetical protein HME9304_00350 [Flagellimonas maritima]|uniref:DUF2752 domain-containing protein n=1 Tax=Flagellimonas maritima TaxID=1383885 RepID=A0A2Z4LND7_9FLAO|nr:DUF2752 domain-containing protein [Allomuricauda aurantiaca]AWX43362.1 hypothetical protein HME9304_00350 [Allomuricauda aurantiaca]
MFQQFIPLLVKAKDFMLPCLNKKLFGVDCPGCGMQRSAHLLLQGEFMAAFKMYPAIYPLLLLFVFLIINTFLKFKYNNQTIIVLSVLTVGTILINYLLKLIYQ